MGGRAGRRKGGWVIKVAEEGWRIEEDEECEVTSRGDEKWRRVAMMTRGKGSGKRRWVESEVDGAGEFDGERGDVVHPCTAGFAFKEGGGVSREEERDEGRGR
jgi:hypothetical protein